MNGYTKLFQSIVTSSIWTEDDRTRIVWVTMLAMADKHGEIQAAIPGLARLAGVSIEDCQKAIDRFMGPDPHSRTTDFKGRRLEKIDGGWALLNHAKYRRMASDIDRKEQATERKRRQRERDALRDVTPKPKESRDVTPSHTEVTPERAKADTEAEAEAEENTLTQFELEIEVEPLSAEADVVDVPKPDDSSGKVPLGIVFLRTQLLEALVAVDGTDPSKATSPMFGQAAKALKIIQEVSMDVTVEMIQQKAKAYRDKFRDAAISSSAVAKHWGGLNSTTTARKRRSDPNM